MDGSMGRVWMCYGRESQREHTGACLRKTAAYLDADADDIRQRIVAGPSRTDVRTRLDQNSAWPIEIVLDNS
jgi:hypothetical protein